MNHRIRNVDWNKAAVTFAAITGVTFCAVVMGFIASTANPVIVGLGVGVVAGGMLLTVPKVTLWLAIALGLSTGALLSMAGGAAGKLTWGVVLLSYMLLLPAFLRLTRLPAIPVFLWIYGAFVLESLITSLIHWHSAGELISGIKRYHQGSGILLALLLLPLTLADCKNLKRMILGIALLQLPFCLYEYFVLVPLRSRGQAGSEVTDVIAGTFGANLRGGSPNAEMATFVMIILAYLWARKRDGAISRKHFALLASLCAPCLFLGEVKIVAIIFPLLAWAIYRKDIVQRPARYLPGVLATAVITIAMGYLYFAVLSNNGTDIAKGIENSLRYNIADQGYGSLYLNRTSVLSFWWSQQGAHDPVSLLFGNGLGSAFSSSDAGIVSGHIAANFPNYGIGLTTTSMLLWDTGAIGLLLFLAVFVSAWIEGSRAYARTNDQNVRSTILVLQGAIAVFILQFNYNNSMLNILPFQIVVAVVLGYLGHIVLQTKRQQVSPARDDGVSTDRNS